MAQAYIHQSVLLPETVSAVLGFAVPTRITQDIDGQVDKQSANRQKVHGIFVDATFGRGGHSRLLLDYLADDARLLVFDKDPEAIAAAQMLAAKDDRITVVHNSFAALKDVLLEQNISAVDGIMADLGVSSPQLDDGARGFSFNKEGAIDMRMDSTQGETVGQWLARASESEIADVLYQYGDERHSRRIARAIKQMPHFESTLLLADTIKAAHPNWQKGKHPATQSFQAMRIFINDELGDVRRFLAQTISALKVGGRLAVISFHSLEDRLIKQFLQDNSRGRHAGDDALPMPQKRAKYFAKPKRIAPDAAEVAQNPRARSALLRVAVRMADRVQENVKSQDI